VKLKYQYKYKDDN